MSFKLKELDNATENVLCPICKHMALNWSEEQYIQPCEHTAFIALDLGFEYVADFFEDEMQSSVDEIHDQSLNVFDAITTAHCNLRIYKMPLGVANYNRYVGFVM